MEDYFDLKFTVDGVLYEAQAWPDEDRECKFCQVTYFDVNQPQEARIVYLDNPAPGEWKQRIVDDEEKMMSAEFIAELGKQIDVVQNDQVS